MSYQPVIEVSNLCKVYNQGAETVFALNGVSLSVLRGEFLAVVGASGSGKSTLMNMLGCLDRPTSGSYMLDGEDVSKLSDSRLSQIRNRKIGFVFQGFNLIPSLNAEENVELILKYRGKPKHVRSEAAEKALDAVGLSNRRSHRPSELSGGQQQRVCIARCIAADPKIILADEPTGNLDSSTGAEIMKILASQTARSVSVGKNGFGKTLVVITHDPSVAALADRVITISDGHIA